MKKSLVKKVLNVTPDIAVLLNITEEWLGLKKKKTEVWHQTTQHSLLNTNRNKWRKVRTQKKKGISTTPDSTYWRSSPVWWLVQWSAVSHPDAPRQSPGTPHSSQRLPTVCRWRMMPLPLPGIHPLSVGCLVLWGEEIVRRVQYWRGLELQVESKCTFLIQGESWPRETKRLQ